IDVECPDIREFARALHTEAPAHARILECGIQALPEVGYAGFQIIASEPEPGAFTLISPDLATCPDCLRELQDPSNRRHRYPFTTCTTCGPRYPIPRAVPYARANTPMASFIQCPDCAREYTASSNRRFHAEPNACPLCGPRLTPSIDHALTALRD